MAQIESGAFAVKTYDVGEMSAKLSGAQHLLVSGSSQTQDALTDLQILKLGRALVWGPLDVPPLTRLYSTVLQVAIGASVGTGKAAEEAQESECWEGGKERGVWCGQPWVGQGWGAGCDHPLGPA